MTGLTKASTLSVKPLTELMTAVSPVPWPGKVPPHPLQFVDTPQVVVVCVVVFAALASAGASTIAAKRTMTVTSVAPREAPMMRRLRVWAAGFSTADKSLFSVGMGGTRLLWLFEIAGRAGRHRPHQI